MTDWYLITPQTNPNSIGGYENDFFMDYKESAFFEVLGTDIASTVTLYNSDLSESKSIRCVIEGNTPDTQLKSMERIGLFPIGTVKSGMYIFFENRYWLITGYPGNNHVYEKATIALCQYKLRWQDENDNIIERWANFTSASKYDTGHTGNEYIILTSNNFTILIPEDDDGATLDEKRVFIDRDLISPTKVFDVTRSDDVLYLYGDNHGGLLSFIASKTEFNPEVDNQELRICNYRTPAPDVPLDETANLYAKISGENRLKIGYSRTYTAILTYEDGTEATDCAYTWNVVSDFDVEQTIKDNNGIELFVDDDNLCGSSFNLQLLINDSVVAEITIDIIDGM